MWKQNDAHQPTKIGGQIFQGGQMVDKTTFSDMSTIQETLIFRLFHNTSCISYRFRKDMQHSDFLSYCFI